MKLITMSKIEAEKKLGKSLTNQEYCKYIHDLNFGNKKQKQTVKKQTIVFNDNKAEFLTTIEKQKEKDYYNSTYEYALKFDDNFLLFEKPRIKKSFCFGHGLNGVSTEEQAKAAHSMCDYASTDSEYFLTENLSGLNEKIETMKIFLMDSTEKKQQYAHEMYKKTNKYFYINISRISHIYLCKNNGNTLYLYEVEIPEYDNRLKYQTVIKELEKEDIKQILSIYEKQKENFTKRLNTYLKKYGLSKLHTWTYLVD